jgi:hypothetical protein
LDQAAQVTPGNVRGFIPFRARPAANPTSFPCPSTQLPSTILAAFVK